MKTAICVIIKDELDYLDEWLDYHFDLGIDEIYLYEDYGSLSHSTITKKYGDKVHLESIDIIFDKKDSKHGVAKQIKLFDWFPITYKDKFDWVLFIDIDEFLILKQPLQQLLKDYDDKPGLLLKWRYYGANGHKTKPKGKVMDNYTKYSVCNFDYYWSKKSFVNLKYFTYWEITIHAINGGVYPINEFGDCKAYINHYFTKSWDEWKYKLLSRGDVAINNRKIYQFFKLNPDMLHMKNDLLLEIAIENATKLGFNKNYNPSDYNKKYVHFCWFGENKFSDLNLKCIESWKKYIPDNYVFCLWNESSSDYNESSFAKEAYYNKQWAFVGDYIRLWAIYNFGGIYLDVDVELLKPITDLPDNFLAIEPFYNNNFNIAMGLGFGAEKNNNIIKNILDIYSYLEFNNDFKFELTSSLITTRYLLNNGYAVNNKNIHEFLGFTIYPTTYFCPKSFITDELNITNDTISIHHYQKTWVI